MWDFCRIFVWTSSYVTCSRQRLLWSCRCLQAMASRNLVIIAQTLSVVARPVLLHYTLNMLAESCKVEFDLWARGNSMTGRPTTHKVFMCMSLLMSLFMNICALCRMAYKRTSCRASMIALQRDWNKRFHFFWCDVVGVELVLVITWHRTSVEHISSWQFQFFCRESARFSRVL